VDECKPLHSGNHSEAGTPTTVVTGRVIQAPTPPRRNLVPIAMHDGSEAGAYTRPLFSST